MSDIGQIDAGAAAPVAPAPTALAPAMESYVEAATARLTAVKADRAWAGRYLRGGAAERNEFKTLLELANASGRSEPEQAALAQSIGLAPRASLARAEQARAAAEAAEEATRLPLAFRERHAFREVLPAVQADWGEWAKALQLPPSLNQTVLSRIASEGPKLADMTPAAREAWGKRQSEMLERAAGSPEKAATWRAAAEKLLAGSKYHFGNAPVMADAFVVRSLALAASNKQEG